jgi:hypothetical protein
MGCYGGWVRKTKWFRDIKVWFRKDDDRREARRVHKIWKKTGRRPDPPDYSKVRERLLVIEREIAEENAYRAKLRAKQQAKEEKERANKRNVEL